VTRRIHQQKRHVRLENANLVLMTCHLLHTIVLQTEARVLAAERDGVAADMEALGKDLRAREGDVADRESQLVAAEAAFAEQRRGMSAAVEKVPLLVVPA